MWIQDMHTELTCTHVWASITCRTVAGGTVVVGWGYLTGAGHHAGETEGRENEE